VLASGGRALEHTLLGGLCWRRTGFEQRSAHGIRGEGLRDARGVKHALGETFTLAVEAFNPGMEAFNASIEAV